MATKWTEERDERLMEMWGAGLSGSIIGEALGISRNAAIGRAHRLGLPHKKTSVSLRTEKKPDRMPAPRKNGITFGRSPPPRQISPPAPPDTLAELEGDVARVEWPEPGRCKWPVGEPGRPGFGFCGAEEFYKSYCAEHYQRSRSRR